MFLSFNDALCEAVVESEIQSKVSNDDFRLAASFRNQADAIYANFPSRKREAAFFVLYRRFFRKFGYAERVKTIMAEFAGEGELPSECYFTRTFRDEEESAQLSEDGTRLGVQIKVGTLREPERCAYLLRHELTHILDILDPTFEYDTSRPLSEVSPSEESLFRDRYRTLWDLSVDGRLERKGFLPQDLRERRSAEFRTLFPNLDERAAEQVFTTLWSGARPSNTDLRQMVTGAAALCATLKISVDISAEGEPHATFGPGSLCPLCRFPTHEWAEATERFSQQVKSEYPGWEPSQGICSQCANRYLFTAAFSMDSQGS
jgi:hypothetical protein